MRRLNRLGFCGLTLWLLARTRVPQVVLLTQQADPSQNGVYEVVLGSERRGHVLARVGDPTRPLTVELGAGWAVADAVDPHGFSTVVQVVDQATTDGLLGTLRALAIGSAEGQAAIHTVGVDHAAAAQPWAVGS